MPGISGDHWSRWTSPEYYSNYQNILGPISRLMFTDFYRFLGLSWETSTFKNYHPDDSERSGSVRDPSPSQIHGTFSRESTFHLYFVKVESGFSTIDDRSDNDHFTLPDSTLLDSTLHLLRLSLLHFTSLHLTRLHFTNNRLYVVVILNDILLETTYGLLMATPRGLPARESLGCRGHC